MRLIFRADASSQIGSGHVMRCSAIAEEAISRGISAMLVGSTGGLAWLDKRLDELGIDVLSIQDFQYFEFSVGDVLVTDSYSSQKIEHFISRSNGIRVVALIDNVTPEHDADLFIHPGLDGSWFSGERAKFIFGANFIPLRKSIKKLDVGLGAKLNKLLVFGGGTDPFGFGPAIAESLRGHEGFQEAVFFSSAESGIEELDNRFRVMPVGAALDVEIEDADLVFTTASTSSLEIVAREIPLGIGCAVANQSNYYKALSELNVSIPLGVRMIHGKWNLDYDSMWELITNAKLRENLIVNARGFIDLHGARRILDAILDL